MGKTRNKNGFPGNSNELGRRSSRGVEKSETSVHQKTSNPGEQIQSNEQANALLPQALEGLSPENLEAVSSSAPDNFDPNELWKNAQVFALAIKRLENENQQLESQKQEVESLQVELKVKQTESDHDSQKIAERSKLLDEDRERLNQRLAEISQRERHLQEKEANAAAGFLAQNGIALSQLEQQVEQLSQGVAQAYSKKAEILKQAEEEVAQKYAELEQEISEMRQEFERDKQKSLLEHKQLRREQSRLEADQELLNEDRQAFEEKVVQRAAIKIAELETQITLREELYKGAEQREKRLAIKYAKIIDANRLFGNRTPDEILVEIEELRQQNLELEQKLAERPTEAAARRLEDLEAHKEQWDAERFRLNTKVQELERSAATNRIAVLNLETLRDEKEALEASNNRLRAALQDLRKEVDDGISQSKERSPFEKCLQVDKDEKLQLTLMLSQEAIDLNQFAEDLRFRVAVSQPDKRLYYSKQDIRAFLGGIAMSKLHILQGISGTGKTSLPIAFAGAMGQKGHANYKLIEVQAGWRDCQDLLGYYNSFEGKYYETEFLTALYKAQCPEFQDQIYIIILDEMNLSRPEQYFADFLSKLEQAAPELRLNTDLDRPSPKLFRGNDTLVIPPNVWFIGTANQDETTLEFADKTYDRAHLMELARSQESFDIPKLPARHPISYQALMTAFKEAQKEYNSGAAKAFSFLTDSLYDLLERKFKISWGNRLERQMHHYIPVVLAAGGSLTEATDHILATKILRKIRDRHDTQPADLKELQNAIKDYWSELDANEPVKSLKILELELQRLERGVY